jgi:hypothetical protein
MIAARTGKSFNIGWSNAEEADMTTPVPDGRPDIERPIDLTDLPEHREPGRVPPPGRHPAETGRPETGAPPPTIAPQRRQ